MTNRGFLADTNIISEIMKPRPSSALEEWVRSDPTIQVPYPAILEIEWGVLNRQRRDPIEAARLREWLDVIVEAAGNRVPLMTPKMARLEAAMMELPALKSLWFPHDTQRPRPPGQDLSIAAIAIEHGLPIATLNTRDFIKIHQHFPLPGVYNPQTDWWAVPLKRGARKRRSPDDTLAVGLKFPEMVR